ncbi:MAG TPA: hypothetical protein DDZ90_05855, partial [Planctomycetaceae bacterium]|nr:hypothetical protein [Planctomycetaceae bacterium]
MNRIELNSLDQQQLLALLRAYQLCLIRLGSPTETQADELKQRLKPLYPHASSSANHLLGELLVYLNAEEVVPQTLSLLTEISTQEEQIRAARTLTFAKQNWTRDQQQQILQWLAHARTFIGGKQLTERLRDIREDFLKTLSDQQRQQFSKEIAELDKPLVEAELVPA